MHRTFSTLLVLAVVLPGSLWAAAAEQWTRTLAVDLECGIHASTGRVDVLWRSQGPMHPALRLTGVCDGEDDGSGFHLRTRDIDADEDQDVELIDESQGRSLETWLNDGEGEFTRAQSPQGLNGADGGDQVGRRHGWLYDAHHPSSKTWASPKRILRLAPPVEDEDSGPPEISLGGSHWQRQPGQCRAPPQTV